MSISDRARFTVWTDRLSSAQDRHDSDAVDRLARALYRAHPRLTQRLLAWVGHRACTRILEGL